MKDSNFGLIITASICFCVLSMAAGVRAYPMQNGEAPYTDTNEMVGGQGGKIQQQPSLEDEIKMRLYLLEWLQRMGRDPLLNERILKKRTCLINAGLSHSCDYKNALAAIDEGHFFNSDQTPGKK